MIDVGPFTRIETDVSDFIGSNDEIARAIEGNVGMLKHGKIQIARQLLSGRANEIRVITAGIGIPLGPYPAEIKQILPLLDAGKIDQAAVDLDRVLDTLVVTTEIMPLPVFRVKALLTVAAEMEYTEDLSKEQTRVEIQKFINAAKDKLKLAEILGNAVKDDYKVLYKEIGSIDKALFTEKIRGSMVKNQRSIH